METIRVLLAVVLVCGVAPTLVWAHSESASWEQVFNKYKVDVGYDPASFVVGEPVRLDFNVTKEQSGQDVEFTDVGVQVLEGQKIVFATVVHKPSIGHAAMTMTFPAAGVYSLHVRFEQAGAFVVEAAFPMTVSAVAVPKKSIQPSSIVAWVGWPMAVVVSLYFMNARKAKLV